jgi:hypothetical protein
MKKWKIWLGVLVVFLSGVVIGVLGTGVVLKHAMHGIVSGDPQAVERMVMRRLTRQLDLTSEQQPEVARIVRGVQGELAKLHERTRPDIERIMEEGLANLSAALSPEQQKKARVLYDKSRERWERHRAP